eukprot:198643-Prymnesium_polylepis.1
MPISHAHRVLPCFISRFGVLPCDAPPWRQSRSRHGLHLAVPASAPAESTPMLTARTQAARHDADARTEQRGPDERGDGVAAQEHADVHILARLARSEAVDKHREELDEGEGVRSRDPLRSYESRRRLEHGIAHQIDL